ncbi:hypothetical protein TTHERM_000656028 (macronuclear) [Tetrahymena thermophila SB210]|uniref:Uncharacterized protein n=1 Tax=Tetrahymena thermophila (strain SB210) TaxID=312017 RepID=W7XH42_TETTS|nr:hypothetical protein TTHERM_000656028 [Tetrahymena thermophila SB210]EWS72319.1 hypothetical protein TTHERM_000656028 [Tetrahymena thermophila SB210]|eukprot:XP_012655153.1 hypothetical protein TTHERM_000656028 [Tetrahymena thermophila SB210]
MLFLVVVSNIISDDQANHIVRLNIPKSQSKNDSGEYSSEYQPLLINLIYLISLIKFKIKLHEIKLNNSVNIYVFLQAKNNDLCLFIYLYISIFLCYSITL